MRTILGPGGKLRGYVRESGDRKELLSAGGRVLGYYDETNNMTYETGGRFVGYGDQLIDLLED